MERVCPRLGRVAEDGLIADVAVDPDENYAPRRRLDRRIQAATRHRKATPVETLAMLTYMGACNRLLRHWLTKGTDLSGSDGTEIRRIRDTLNGRPANCGPANPSAMKERRPAAIRSMSNPLLD